MTTTATILATIHSGGHTAVRLTRHPQRPDLLGVAVADQFGDVATARLDHARVGALIAALQAAHQEQAGR